MIKYLLMLLLASCANSAYSFDTRPLQIEYAEASPAPLPASDTDAHCQVLETRHNILTILSGSIAATTGGVGAVTVALDALYPSSASGIALGGALTTIALGIGSVVVTGINNSVTSSFSQHCATH